MTNFKTLTINSNNPVLYFNTFQSLWICYFFKFNLVLFEVSFKYCPHSYFRKYYDDLTSRNAGMCDALDVYAGMSMDRGRKKFFQLAAIQQTREKLSWDLLYHISLELLCFPPTVLPFIPFVSSEFCVC